MTAYIILAAYNFISEGRAFASCIETDVVQRTRAVRVLECGEVSSATPQPPIIVGQLSK